MPNITLKGIRLFPKNDKQPDFVIASGVITPDDLMAFLIDNKEHESTYQDKQQFRIQILKGKEGSGPYIQLDTYKPAQAPTSAPGGAAPDVASQEDLDKLPF